MFTRKTSNDGGAGARIAKLEGEISKLEALSKSLIVAMEGDDNRSTDFDEAYRTAFEITREVELNLRDAFLELNPDCYKVTKKDAQMYNTIKKEIIGPVIEIVDKFSPAAKEVYARRQAAPSFR